MYKTNLLKDYFRVHLNVFEGPLDLLLYLIRKNELDIHEISLATITDEYLQYIKFLKTLDLEMAGEFIITAATLLRIKAASLFPSRRMEPEEETLRDELIRNLIEYQQLSAIAEKLRNKELERRKRFTRPGKPPEGVIESESQLELNNFQVYDLLGALRDVLKNVSNGPSVHSVEVSSIRIEDRIDEILEELSKKHRMRFDTLISGKTRMFIIVSFIAILELIRSGRVTCSQSRQFGTIWLSRLREET